MKNKDIKITFSEEPQTSSFWHWVWEKRSRINSISYHEQNTRVFLDATEEFLDDLTMYLGHHYPKTKIEPFVGELAFDITGRDLFWLEGAHREHMKQCDILEKKGCSGRLYGVWRCCEEHRMFSEMSSLLTMIARSFNITSRGSALSAAWWRDAGSEEMYTFLDEHWRCE